MKGKTIGKILQPLLVLLPMLQQGVMADYTNLPSRSYDGDITLHHVYLAGSDPRERAVIGRALTRLGYVPSGRPDAVIDNDSATKDDSRPANREIYSYTEISTSRDVFGGVAPILFSDDDLLARWGENQTALEADTKGWSLKTNINAAQALGTQAENWVALCDFLGLGYSTVERLKLWQFP